MFHINAKYRNNLFIKEKQFVSYRETICFLC